MENNQHILIIAFAFAPNKRVGAMRASYWYKTLPKHYNCSVSVITDEKEATGENVHVVPMKGTSNWSWITRDEGLVWKKNIKDYLTNTTIKKPDTVIITGGPFMHFILAKWLKKKYNCKIVLDYRDPFAINPGFKNARFKVWLKTQFEKRFNRLADALVTVNDYCGKLVIGFNQKPNAIVQNGYDETVTSVPTPVAFSNEVSFVYAGKFYFHPEHMQEAFQQEKVSMTYIGPDEKQLNVEKEYIYSKGFVDYKTAIDCIGSCDVGVIQTYGHEFQSTTKIFDYVRCNRAILIISDDKTHEGSIHDELNGYPNVFWAKNNTSSIIEAIQEIKQADYIQPPEGRADKYSRRNQMNYLIDLLDQLA